MIDRPGPSLRRLRTLVLMLSMTLLVAACGSSGSGGGGGGSSSASASTFTIPWVDTLTGSFAPLLNPQKDSVKLAIKEINAKGGVNGHPLAVQEVDDGGTPQGAIQAIRKVIGNALFVLSSVPTNSAQGSFPIANQDHVVIYGPAITTASVVTGNQPYCFTGWPDTSKGASALAKAFTEAHAGVKKVAMILDTADSAAKSQGALLKTALESQGATVLDPIAVQTQQLDFSAAVNKARDQHPDALMIATEANSAGAILKQETSIGWKVPNIGPRSSWSPDVLPKVAGQAALADYWTYEFWDPNSSDTAKKYAADYKAATGRTADDTGAFAYEAVYLLADMMKSLNLDATGSALQGERDKLQKKLAGLQGYQGVFGPISFSDGIANRTPYVLHGDSSGTMQLSQSS